MDRVKLHLFFDYEHISQMQHILNNIMHNNKSLNIIVESIGIIYDNHQFNINTSEDGDIDILIEYGNAFIIIEGNPEIIELFRNILETLMFKLQVITDDLLPNEFNFGNKDNKHEYFIKNLKSRTITNGNVAEILFEGFGTIQNSSHTDELLKVNDIHKIFITPDNYMISLHDDELWNRIPDNTIPSVRVHKIGYPNDLTLPRVKTRETCLECYILKNIDSWKRQLNKLNEGEVENEYT